jgi:hypothetical protein
MRYRPRHVTRAGATHRVAMQDSNSGIRCFLLSSRFALEQRAKALAESNQYALPRQCGRLYVPSRGKAITKRHE